MNEDILQQISKLSDFYKGLALTAETEDSIKVAGPLYFEADSENLDLLSGTFDIELEIHKSYPEQLPIVKETAGKIPKEFGHINPNGTLCLGVPTELRRLFLYDPTLIGFVSRLVVPFLYGFLYWNKHGTHPFGECPHGDKGIVQHYMDNLSLSDEVTALTVICFLYRHGYRGHHPCPCGSKLRVRSCHGKKLFGLHSLHTQYTIESDFRSILSACSEKIKAGDLPASLSKQLRTILRKNKA